MVENGKRPNAQPKHATRPLYVPFAAMTVRLHFRATAILCMAILVVATCLSLCTVVAQTPSEQARPEQARPEQALAGILPSESLLPGVATIKPSRQWPSEALLPGPTGDVGKDGSRGNANSGVAQPGVTNQLPSEHQLPVGINAVAAQPNMLQTALSGSRDDRIRLRLAIPEHTSNVMALAFDATSSHMFSGGDDKVVHHWELANLPGQTAPQWVHQETIRWQVGSGQVGFVRALACSDGILCMAGYGAEGTRGEILRYDWANRRWLAPWVDHARPIVTLVALPGSRVLSVDEHLGVGIRGPNEPFRWLKKPDLVRLGYWPVVAWSNAATSHWAMSAAGDQSPWQIQANSLSLPFKSQQFSPAIRPGQEQSVLRPLIDYRKIAFPNNDPVRDAQAIAKLIAPDVYLLAASDDGRMLAAVDDADPKAFGMWMYVWRDGQLILKHRIVNPGDAYRNLAWSRSGNELAVLTDSVQNNRPVSIVEIWRFDQAVPRVTPVARYNDQCFHLKYSPDGKWLGIGSRSGVKLIEWLPVPKSRRLPDQSRLAAIDQISFATGGLAWQGTTAAGTIQFDPTRMALFTGDGPWQPQMSPSDGWRSGSFSVQSRPDGYHVLRDQIDLGMVDPCDTRVVTPIETVQWIKDASGNPIGIAVVYRMQRENEIHIFALPRAENGRLRRVRIFNGHEGQVRSLSVSADGRFMVSSGSDRLVCTWPLAGIPETINAAGNVGAQRTPPDLDDDAEAYAQSIKVASSQKWGASWTIENGKLMLAALTPAAPLFEFGLRSGDEIIQLNWFSLADDGSTAIAHPINPGDDAIRFLDNNDFDTIIKFSYSRAGSDVQHVQLKPQWRPLISQTFSQGREWAAWTAAGYYTSSFNGNTLFGWQVNRGVQNPPDFYRADRFQALLERPEVLKRVLSAGSVEQAARAVGERIGSNFHPLENSVALQPQVRLLRPQPGFDSGDSSELIVEAEIVLPRGSEITTLKAFANGVPAVLSSSVQQNEVSGAEGQVKTRVTWRAGLPSDSTIKVQVAVANQERLVGTDEVLVRRADVPSQPRRPRLWIFAGGVGHYADDRIAPLKTPEQNVDAFIQGIERASGNVYDCQVPLALTGPGMTRNNWLAIVHDKLSELQSTVRPDDVVIVFLSGHGLQDPETQEYFFVTADANYSHVLAGNFARCLGVSEIAPFADLACRKVVILDTCHSGALQPLESDRLKSAVRLLQADLVLTLTASEGDAAAAEVVGHSNSLFTEVLGQSLSAPLDTNADRLYTWPELVQQVRDGVLAQSTAMNVAQMPTVVPAELLPYIQLPLTLITVP